MKFFKESIDTERLTQILETSIPKLYSTETVSLIDNALYNNEYMSDLIDGESKGELIREKCFLERVRTNIEEHIFTEEPDNSINSMRA